MAQPELRAFTSVCRANEIVSYQSFCLYFVIFRKIYDHTENHSIVYKYRPFTSLLPVRITIFHTCNDFQLQVHSSIAYLYDTANISRTKVILQRIQVLILYLPSGLFCNVCLFCCCCLLECQSVFRECATTEGINSIPDTASGYLQFVDGCFLTIDVFWQGFLLTTKLCLSD